ncbi:hypothetical protein JW911_01365 [Candidatus Peregrinibacteria bacterium]|nr:hypothetical protein [Candidatus Peregrinibacteria bacterium]
MTYADATKNSKNEPIDEFASFADELREHVGGLDSVDIWGNPVGQASDSIQSRVQETVEALTQDKLDEKKWNEFKGLLKIFAELDSMLEKKPEELDMAVLHSKIKEIEINMQDKTYIISHSAVAPIRKFLDFLLEGGKEKLEKFKQYFHQLIHLLSALINDPNVHGRIERPFEKELIHNTMEAFKIPACPPTLLAKLYKKYQNNQTIIPQDFKDYNIELNKELEPDFNIFYDLKKSRTEHFSKNPYSKEYAYWSRISEVEMYKELLQWKTLQLLFESAGEKKLPFEFLSHVYDALAEYEKNSGN